MSEEVYHCVYHCERNVQRYLRFKNNKCTLFSERLCIENYADATLMFTEINFTGDILSLCKPVFHAFFVYAHYQTCLPH